MSRNAKALVSGLVGGFVGVFAAVFVMAQYSDYRAQSQIDGWLTELEPVQVAIATNALAAGKVDEAGRGVEPPALESTRAALHVSVDGTIRVRGGVKGQLIVLEPILADGVVTWRCIGGSHDAVRVIRGNWCADPLAPPRPTPSAR
jgi:hypothetical protein